MDKQYPQLNPRVKPAKLQPYRGRFAPSPTGLLHIGSLIAAVASYLDAKSNNGIWLVRLEDLDPPREVAGAAQSILSCLEAHGLQWDEEILWQSQQQPYYQQAVSQLLSQGDAFYCKCSRKDLLQSNNIHSGNCQHRKHGKENLTDSGSSKQNDCAIRVQINDNPIHFEDTIQGQYCQYLNREAGDFVIRRKDGYFAYQLAVVVDDNLQNISHVVRGSDLLDSTPRQIFLQKLLKLPTLNYSHFPVVTNTKNQKLSKQTLAATIVDSDATNNLIQALNFLQQPMPKKALQMKPRELLSHAVEKWSINRIPGRMSMMETHKKSMTNS